MATSKQNNNDQPVEDNGISHYARYTEAHKKYQNSEKGKAARAKYQSSEKGKAARKRAQQNRADKIKEALRLLDEKNS
jgi:hypothetical protein